jgi:hypothetical protein
MPVIPATGRLGQEDFEFQASLTYKLQIGVLSQKKKKAEKRKTKILKLLICKKNLKIF